MHIDNQTKLASVKIGGVYHALSEGSTIIDGVECSLEVENKSKGLYSWLLRIKNTTDHRSPRIQEMLGFDFLIPVRGYASFNTLRGDDCTTMSFMPETFSLNDGEEIVRKPDRGRSSNKTAFPYFDILDDEQKGIVAGIGWSGQWLLHVARDGDNVRIQCGQEDCDFILEPGEAVRSVRALVFFGEGSTDELRHAFVRKTREHYSPIPKYNDSIPFPISSCSLNLYYWGSWGQQPKDDEIVYFETEEAQHDLCESMSRCKSFNAQWIDASWFKGTFRNGVGNFSYSRGFPRGLRPVADHVHRHGMRLIVWFEAIRAYPGTEVYERFHNDPTKIIKLPETSGWDKGRMLVNIGDEEVWQYVFERISSVIEESGIDIYRQDFNINPLEYMRTIEGPDRKGIAQIRLVEGMYKLWDKLLERFPGLTIDNCSSGGRLLDVETNMRSYPLLQSDMQCRPFPIAMQNENLALSRYIPWHQCGSFDQSAYFMRSAFTVGIDCEFEFLSHILGSEIVKESLNALNEKEKERPETPEEPEEIPHLGKFSWELSEAAVADVKRLKEYWGRGDFTGLTEPSVRRDVISAYTLRIPEEDRGVIVVLRRNDAPSDFTIRLPEINQENEYRLTMVDEQRKETTCIVSGKQLMAGYEITIPEAPGSAMIFYSVR